MHSNKELKKYYRHYLYLDSYEIVNAEAVIGGGETIEEVQKITREGGGNLGLKFALFGALGVDVSGKRGRQIERTLSLRRNVHVLVDKFIHKIEPDGVAKVQSPADLQRLRENELVILDVDLSSNLYCSAGNLGSVPPADQDEQKREDRQLDILANVLHTKFKRLFHKDLANEWLQKKMEEYGSEIAWEVPILSGDTEELEGISILLFLETQWLVGNAWDLSRRATVVGQVIGVAKPGEKLVVQRHTGGARSFSFLLEKRKQPATGSRPSHLLPAATEEVEGHDKQPVDTGSLHEFAVTRVVVKPLAIFK